jgi:hypothetical protein
MTEPVHPQILELLDKQALHDNLMRYCRGVDRMDLELIRSAYWSDSTDDHGRFIGPGHAWAEMAYEARKVLVGTNHHVSNVYIELDGTLAKRESMFVNVNTYLDGSPTMMLGGRYRDLCEKRDGEWRILRRVCIWDWNQLVEPDPGWHVMRVPEWSNWGRFHPDDPIYQDWQTSQPTLAADSHRPEASGTTEAGTLDPGPD